MVFSETAHPKNSDVDSFLVTRDYDCTISTDKFRVAGSFLFSTDGLEFGLPRPQACKCKNTQKDSMEGKEHRLRERASFPLNPEGEDFGAAFQNV